LHSSDAGAIPHTYLFSAGCVQNAISVSDPLSRNKNNPHRSHARTYPPHKVIKSFPRALFNMKPQSTFQMDSCALQTFLIPSLLLGILAARGAVLACFS
jgi:hypothetical protein